MFISTNSKFMSFEFIPGGHGRAAGRCEFAGWAGRVGGMGGRPGAVT